ncbi:hypothetical protein [Clostridium sp. Cult3]|uniref:hypothetical protein n=1 Tax=Clostridium sp. Cult3 TaxID=2079004 RepID=UPI001F21C61D|nr:hypothetical protein [Clostridium sp. Cult3]
MDWLKEKNSSKENNLDSRGEWESHEEPIELEKNDILAIIISAILVFGPIFLVFIGILFWCFSF